MIGWHMTEILQQSAIVNGAPQIKSFFLILYGRERSAPLQGRKICHILMNHSTASVHQAPVLHTEDYYIFWL